MENLFLSNNKVKNVTPVAQLRNLAALWLDENPITNVLNLAELKGLYLLIIPEREELAEQIARLREKLSDCCINISHIGDATKTDCIVYSQNILSRFSRH